MKVGDKKVIWEPHPGSQERFLACPAREVLIGGNRGGGKTDSLLMDYLQHVGGGYGADWRGIIFREAYPHLLDLINKSKKWIRQIFPSATYNEQDHKWKFPTGEILYLRFMRVEDDYWNYHGHEYPFCGFEELTNWTTDACYRIMMSCNRSSNPNVPRKYRATCNPSGPGHSWVKSRFIDVAPPLKIHRPKDNPDWTRVFIPSSLDENLTLMKADPTYKQTMISACEGDPIKYKAWILGDWDIVAGGALSDVWDIGKQVLEPFQIPRSWHIYRSFDWGSAKPWAVTYGAECNGEQPDGEGLPYFTPGSVVVVSEIYGWTGAANEGDRATSQEIAERVHAVDTLLSTQYSTRVLPGPADTSIWEVRDGVSIAQNLSSHGCEWARAYKGAGSRAAGLAIMRQMLYASKHGNLEKPGLYFFDTARNHIRTLPILQYDKKRPEDIDTEQEDHAYDSIRYLLSRKFTMMKRRKVKY